MKEAQAIDRKTVKMKHHEPDFKGYTISELKYQKAVLQLKKEILKERALNEVKAIKGKLPFSKNNNSENSKKRSSGLVNKLLKGLEITDYIMIGYSLFKTGKKIFRRKKK